MQEHSEEGVHVSAVGSYVTKAVTVVEVLKKKVQVGHSVVNVLIMQIYYQLCC